MSKYKITPAVSELQVTEFFKEDPKLVLLGLSDEELTLLHETKLYSFAPGSHYLAVMNEEYKTIAVIKYEYFTTHCINFHMYLKSAIHKTAEVKKIADLIKEYFTAQDGIFKVILMVPSSCEHIHSFAPKYGFNVEGLITKCYQWRQKLVDIVIYGLSLKAPSGDDAILKEYIPYIGEK